MRSDQKPKKRCAASTDRRWARGKETRWAALLLGVVLVACGRTQPVPADQVAARLASLDRPNIVWVVIDTLRADWTTPYGSPWDTTPELQAWAQNGIVFEETISQSSWTKTSMASLLTSLWPRTHRVEKTNEGLSLGAVTVAEVLADAGYATYAVQTNGWLEQTFGFQQGFQRYVFPLNTGVSQRLNEKSVWAHADQVYLEAGRILDSVDRTQPFLLYTHLMDVHEYAAPPEFKKFGSDNRAAYLASILWMDDYLRRLREKLESLDLLDNTVIIFGSDHAEAFGEAGKYGHARDVLRPTLWVPFVIRVPFASEPVRVAARVRNIDVAPTILELAGAPIPAAFEGESVLPMLSDPDAEGRVAFASLRDRLYQDSIPQESIFDGRWVYAKDLDHAGKKFLFDIEVDPQQNVNLYELEPKQVERLSKQLEQHLANVPDTGAVEHQVRIRPDLRRRLEALGYVAEEEQ